VVVSIVHAGGESTRLKEIFDGPKALAPIDGHTLLWFHLQPLVKSGVIKEYLFTLRHRSEVIEEYLCRLRDEFHISTSTIVEPKPLGRAGSVRLGIERGIVRCDESCLMSNPDDLVPINIHRLIDYASEAEKNGQSAVMVMARKATNPFGIGVAKKNGRIFELTEFKEKQELALIENHFANTGMILFLPDAMREFRNAPLDRPTHPENEIIPRLVKQNKVAIFVVDKWISVNYAADYRNVLSMGSRALETMLEA
jgi:NDP-sugar pyrophosphorylase family protein